LRVQEFSCCFGLPVTTERTEPELGLFSLASVTPVVGDVRYLL